LAGLGFAGVFRGVGFAVAGAAVVWRFAVLQVAGSGPVEAAGAAVQRAGVRWLAVGGDR